METTYASIEFDPTEYENEPQQLNPGEQMESDEYPNLASRSNFTESAQSALGPNCASSKAEDIEDKDRGNKIDLQKPLSEIAPCQPEPQTTISSPCAEPLGLLKTIASSRDCIDDIFEDDSPEGTLDARVETCTCIKCKRTLPASDFPPKKGRPTERSLWCKSCLPAHLNGQRDAEDELEAAVTGSQQLTPAPVSSEPVQQTATSARKPQPKPESKYGIEQGPVGWYIYDKKNRMVGYALTLEEAWLKAMRMGGTPYDRFNASKSDGVCKVFDTAGGVVKVVKTCATIEEAREEAARLNKESQQPRPLKPAA